MKTTTVVYAVTDCACCDCRNHILAFNEVAYKLIQEAAQKGIAVRCAGCQQFENRKQDLINKKIDVE